MQGILKFLAVAVILAGSSYLGLAYSFQMKKRLLILEDMVQMLFFLRGEIKYHKAPLPEAFEHISRKTTGPCLKMVEHILMDFKKNEGYMFEKIWNTSVKEMLAQTPLKGSDMELVEPLGQALGYLDLEVQVSSIDMVIENLTFIIGQLKEKIPTQQRLYGSLGILGGMFVVLIFI